MVKPSPAEGRDLLLARGWVDQGRGRWRDPAPRRHRGQASICTFARAVQRQRRRDASPHAFTPYPSAAREYFVGDLLVVWRGNYRKKDRVVLYDVASGRTLAVTPGDARKLARVLEQLGSGVGCNGTPGHEDGTPEGEVRH